MVFPYDFLDSMMWSIFASGLLVGIAALRLPLKASTDSVEEKGRNLSIGLAIAIGAMGFYFFITGITISFTWSLGFPPGSQFADPYRFGYFNVLYGGAAGLGGIVLLALAAALFLNKGFHGVSYLALAVGLYLAVDAVAITQYNLVFDRSQLVSLLYLGPAAAGIFSVPATHMDNKFMRWIFAVFAFLFAVAWLYFGYLTTMSHLKP
jgi:uncharacterized membrane protein